MQQAQGGRCSEGAGLPKCFKGLQRRQFEPRMRIYTKRVHESIGRKYLKHHNELQRRVDRMYITCEGRRRCVVLLFP